jgi:hypothetical protein
MPSIKRFIKKPRSYPPQDSNRPEIHANVFTQSGQLADLFAACQEVSFWLKTAVRPGVNHFRSTLDFGHSSSGFCYPVASSTSLSGA